MAKNPPTLTAEPQVERLISTMLSRSLSASLVCCASLLSGCATTSTGTAQTQAIETLPTGSVYTHVIQTLRGMSLKITRIDVPFSPAGHGNAQVAAGYVWATKPSPLGLHKTVRIDAKSYQVAELSRPFTAGGADLLVDEHAVWFSDGISRFSGRGDLYRVDPNTNQITATIEAVGTPFASGDGAVWAYNLRTRVVSGIDTNNNQVRTQLVTQGGPYNDFYTFGAGSIWQFAHEGDVSSWQLVRGATPPSVVRRIDPSSKKVIAEISIGPYRPTDQIRFVAGAVWVLGERDKSGTAFATRIDVKTNLVTATIPLVRTVTGCVVHSLPKTPVFWDGGIWISTFCTAVGGLPGVLLKIDLQTNQVTGQFPLSQLFQNPRRSHPALAVGEGALWGFDGLSAIRFDSIRD